ncbi:MAG: cadmium-translocating P-type ATPase [Synergistaceae bacterium]|nr:cadmium-translocating P-type ATPase [Synergistaceae bacterium]
MNKKQKFTLARIIIAGILLIAFNFFIDAPDFFKPVLFLIPYLIVGYDILLKALKGIKSGQVFDENFLMSVATIGAFCLAIFYTGDYLEAIAVMLFYQIGELFQRVAIGKSRKNISDLMDIRPDSAFVEKNGKLERVDPGEIEIGTIITITPGEKIPIDGIIIEGNSSLDTGALTGESLPSDVKIGDEVKSGCVNLSGVLKVKTTREFYDSTASKILDLVENATSRKSKSENFITKFARVYTPAVCYSALALAILPTIFTGNFETWLYRALTFLVISCPCALVISIPLSFFAGIGRASREGILIKGSNFLETLSKISCVIFDKTGTLTKGVFEVVAVHPEIRTENELLHLAAHVERYSTHPAANALRKAYPNEADDCEIKNVEEIPGFGVRAVVNGEEVCLGSSKFMDKIGAQWHPCEKNGTIIHIAINEIASGAPAYAGHIVISDVIKNNSREAIEELKNIKIKTVMLTGDSEKVAHDVAGELKIENYFSELLPADKVQKAEEILKNYKAAFVGDGINDAPVLSRANVGIAMGALGSDAAIEAADVVLMDDDPLKISRAIKISRKCMKIVKQNIYFSIGVKLICLAAGSLGFANMWLAVFADVGVMVIAVLNAIRVLF